MKIGKFSVLTQSVVNLAQSQVHHTQHPPTCLPCCRSDSWSLLTLAGILVWFVVLLISYTCHVTHSLNIPAITWSFLSSLPFAIHCECGISWKKFHCLFFLSCFVTLEISVVYILLCSIYFVILGIWWLADHIRIEMKLNLFE